LVRPYLYLRPATHYISAMEEVNIHPRRLQICESNIPPTPAGLRFIHNSAKHSVQIEVPRSRDIQSWFYKAVALDINEGKDEVTLKSDGLKLVCSYHPIFSRVKEAMQKYFHSTDRKRKGETTGLNDLSAPTQPLKVRGTQPLMPRSHKTEQPSFSKVSMLEPVKGAVVSRQRMETKHLPPSPSLAKSSPIVGVQEKVGVPWVNEKICPSPVRQTMKTPLFEDAPDINVVPANPAASLTNCQDPPRKATMRLSAIPNLISLPTMTPIVNADTTVREKKMELGKSTNHIADKVAALPQKPNYSFFQSWRRMVTPPSSSHARIGGMRNIGNSCYMNTALQVLIRLARLTCVLIHDTSAGPSRSNAAHG
jgi:hypothetical protein